LQGHQELLQQALLFLICLSYCHLDDLYAALLLSKDGRGLMKDFALLGCCTCKRPAR
jgi:hypothetical protein